MSDSGPGGPTGPTGRPGPDGPAARPGARASADAGAEAAGVAPASSRLAVARRAPIAALTLLTIVPVPARAQRHIGAREVAASAPFFPLVGAVLGLAVGGLAFLVGERAGMGLGAAVVVTLVAALTGALHLDGLADTADALGARGRSRARRLEIMRDSATGAYGTAAIAGWFVLTVAAVAALPPDGFAVTLAWALALSRMLAVAHARVLPAARAEGLGAGFSMSTVATAAALLVVVLIAVGFVLLPEAYAFGGPGPGPGPGSVGPPADQLVSASPFHAVEPLVLLAAALAALATAALVSLAAHRLLGGRTGDTLGATIVLAETAALFVAALAAA